jgi:hypothetical protein
MSLVKTDQLWRKIAAHITAAPPRDADPGGLLSRIRNDSRGGAPMTRVRGVSVSAKAVGQARPT